MGQIFSKCLGPPEKPKEPTTATRPGVASARNEATVSPSQIAPAPVPSSRERRVLLPNSARACLTITYTAPTHSSGHNRHTVDQRFTGPYPGGRSIHSSDQPGQRTPDLVASGQSKPASRPSRQGTFNPQFGDQPTPDPPTTGQPTPNEQSILGDRLTAIRAGAASSGHPSTYSNSQPNPRFGDQPIADPRTSGQYAPNQQRITDPYGGQPIPQATSGGTPSPYSSSQPNPRFGDQSIADPRTSGRPTSYQQRITDPYGGQPIPQATSGGHPSPYSSIRPTPDPGSNDQGDQRTSDPGPSDQSNPASRSSHQPTNNPYFGDQLTPDPPTTGQPTLYQQRIIDPYGGQPIPQATSGGHPGPYSSIQPTPDPRSNDRGGQRTSDPGPSGQGNPASRPSRQPATNPYLGDQRTPDPRPNGQHAPKQQRITDPYSGGQRIPQPNSSGQSISDGIYTITNVYQKRFIYLEDANDTTPLRGHFNQENRSARWHVIQRVEGEYSIKNVDHGRYANCGPRARLDAFVEGHSEEQVWRIQERYEGQYMIAAIDSGNLWMLPDKEKDTPVTFSKTPSDPMCLWSFESAEIAAPVNENPITRPVMPDPEPPLAPSGGQPTPDAAIIEFISVIAGANDLLQPLGAACEALRVVIQRAGSIGHVNEDRKALIKRLNFHLATIENDIVKLEEDQKIDETIPAPNQALRKSLNNYARELKQIYTLLFDNREESSSSVRTSSGHNKGTIMDKPRKIDEAFQKYTDALHQFVANTVAEMRQQLPQFRQELRQGAHTAAETARPNRPNAYGIQHRECLQGTREKTLPAISNWVDNKNAKNWIFFFLDVAGSGKSTVAKHMAEKWEREGRLLAQFFFSRDTTETMSTNSFCSTVAGAFADLDQNYKLHMDRFMARPNVELLSFEKRFEGLVAGPLRAIGRRAILIIDALDECHPEQRDQLLQTLRDKHSSMPLLRILATGRPERDIKHWAEEKFGFGYANFTRLEENDKDVELYIRHTLRDVPDIQDRLYPVIRHAEGLFIWARIACDLLLDSDDIDGLLEQLGKEVSLDYLYKVALEQSMPKEGASRLAMLLVLQMILAAREPLSIAVLEKLSPKRSVVEKVVTRLSSVLLYQGREDPIRLLHATFREFLTARLKADNLFIQLELGHHTLASGCLTTIRNLSKLDTSTLQKLDAISQRKETSFERDTN